MLTLGMAMERVRRDLGDTDAVNAIWSSEDLERHLRHAVREVSEQAPREMKSVLQTTIGSREVSIGGLMGRVGIVAAEWPTGEFPARYVRWSVWQETLTLLTDAAPASVEDVAIYWHGVHDINPEGCTVPGWAEEVLILGAVGYAASEAAARAINRVNQGGATVDRDYQVMAREALGRFRDELRRRGIHGSVRTARFYVPVRAC